MQWLITVLNSLWMVGGSKSTWTEPMEQGLGIQTHNRGTCGNDLSWQQLCISVRGRQRCAGRLTGPCCQEVVQVSVNNINFHLHRRQLRDWGWCRVQRPERMCWVNEPRRVSHRYTQSRICVCACLSRTCARARSPAGSHLAYLHVVLRPEHRHSLC